MLRKLNLKPLFFFLSVYPVVSSGVCVNSIRIAEQLLVDPKSRTLLLEKDDEVLKKIYDVLKSRVAANYNILAHGDVIDDIASFVIGAPPNLTKISPQKVVRFLQLFGELDPNGHSPTIVCWACFSGSKTPEGSLVERLAQFLQSKDFIIMGANGIASVPPPRSETQAVVVKVKASKKDETFLPVNEAWVFIRYVPENNNGKTERMTPFQFMTASLTDETIPEIYFEIAKKVLSPPPEKLSVAQMKAKLNDKANQQQYIKKFMEGIVTSQEGSIRFGSR